jgi:multimeric flavodoxin WrbA
MKIAIILGSSRSNGNTAQLAQYVKSKIDTDYFDLAEFNIKPFNYNNDYQDDFHSLISTLLNYDQLIFATPIYWYSASAQMKVFLDRITDLLSYYKEQGRQLRGKSTALLATGSNSEPPDCFEQLFLLTFDYLGMDYKGMNYCSCPDVFNPDSHQDSIAALIKKIQ